MNKNVYLCSLELFEGPFVHIYLHIELCITKSYQNFNNNSHQPKVIEITSPHCNFTDYCLQKNLTLASNNPKVWTCNKSVICRFRNCRFFFTLSYVLKSICFFSSFFGRVDMNEFFIWQQCVIFH